MVRLERQDMQPMVVRRPVCTLDITQCAAVGILLIVLLLTLFDVWLDYLEKPEIEAENLNNTTEADKSGGE